MSIQWSLALFTALTGVAGWVYACVAAVEARGKAPDGQLTASLVALALGVVGGLASVTHLAHPERIMNVLGHPTEGIFLEAVLAGVMCLAGIVFALLVKRQAGHGARTCAAVVAAVFGVLLSFFAGHSYMMADIPAWNTLLLPVGYLATAAPAGVAVYLVAAGAHKDADVLASAWSKALLWSGVAGAVLGVVYFAVAGNAALAVVVGALDAAAAVCGWAVGARKDKAASALVVALVCSCAAVLVYRVGMWIVFDKAINLFGTVI